MLLDNIFLFCIVIVFYNISNEFEFCEVAC